MSSSIESAQDRRGNLAALGCIADVPLLAAAAMACYFLTIYVLVDRWRIMPVTLNRMVTIREFLADRPDSTAGRDVYVVGSSVVVDGIDCAQIDARLPAGGESFNFAWTGAGPQRWPLLAPSLRNARPAAVVLVVDLTSALHRERVPDDVLAVAGWWEMVPAEDVPAVSRVMQLDSGGRKSALADRLLDRPPLTVRLLTSKVEDLLQFRVLPGGFLEVTARETLRKDLRFSGHASNLKSPWLRKSVVHPAAMQRSVEQVVQQVRTASPDALDSTVDIVQFVARLLAPAECATLVDFAPVNPAVTRRLPEGYLAGMSRTLAQAAAAAGADYVDHSLLLTDAEFSDNVHPFGTGRQRWSAALGQAIGTRLENGL